MPDSAHAEHLLTVAFQQRMCYILISTCGKGRRKNRYLFDVKQELHCCVFKLVGEKRRAVYSVLVCSVLWTQKKN